MGIEKLLSRLTGGGKPISPRTDPDWSGLKPEDIKLCLSGLLRPEANYIYAAYLDDGQARRLLVSCVHLMLADQAIEENWRIIRGSRILAKMASMSVKEVIEPFNCSSCNGYGQIFKVGKVESCEPCGGLGTKPPSDYARAKMLDMDKKNYRNHWKQRYNWIYGEVQEIKLTATGKVISNLKGIRM